MSTGEEEKEIDVRLSRAKRVSGMMNDLIRAKHISKSSKFRTYKTIMRTTAIYRWKT